MIIPKLSQSRGTYYYYDTQTGKTSWSVPTERDFVAIIVPFRNNVQQNRAEQLHTLLTRLPSVLTSVSSCRFKIYVIEQTHDHRKFNRGKLLNAGFQIAIQETPHPPTHVIFHDCDLIPNENTARLYFDRPGNHAPVCIAHIWERYSTNPRYFGGVVSINCEDFQTLNGFPNTFWGWGGEDDELRLRMDYCSFDAKVPEHDHTFSIEDLERLSIEDKLNVLRRFVEWKCLTKRELLNESRETWTTNGLNSCNYVRTNTNVINDYTEVHTVELGLNNHWSDSLCSLDNRTWGRF